jgi:hypothetical protein
MQFKTDWDFMDCTHPDSMYLTFNDYNYTGRFIGGKNLTKEEKLHWHKLEIERINSQLRVERSIKTDNLGIQWANKNAQKMKSKRIKVLLAKRRLHEDRVKFLKDLINEYKKYNIS